MNDILARRERRATVGIALSAALVAGIAPATAIAAETSSPTGAVALQTEDAAAAKERAYAAMQEALKNLEAAKDAASPEKIAEIDDDIAAFQELYDMVVAEAAKRREPLPAMQANVDAAQAKYDEAHNRVSELQAKLDKKLEVLKTLEALGDEKLVEITKQDIRQLRSEIVTAKAQVGHCETELREFQLRLRNQERRVNNCERAVEKYKGHIDQFTAWRDALLDNLKKAQTAYDDASLRLNATRRGDSARCLTCNRQRRPTKLHQAGELEQRQASRYDRRQAREHGRHSAERNSTRRNRRRRPRNNRRSHTPPQELKKAARAYYLRQSTSPETKRGPFPHLRKRASLTAKIQATAPPPLEPRSHQCPDNASKPHSARDRLN